MIKYFVGKIRGLFEGAQINKKTQLWMRSKECVAKVLYAYLKKNTFSNLSSTLIWNGRLVWKVSFSSYRSGKTRVEKLHV